MTLSFDALVIGTVEADGVLYSAERIFINAGGRAAEPPCPAS
jgi:hypothetical protein